MQALKKQFSEQLPALYKELEQYFLAELWPQLAFAAHSLKGSAGSMGYPELTQQTGLLETAAKQQDKSRCSGLLELIRPIIEAAKPTESNR